MPEIILPHLYVPRDYQLPFLSALDSDTRRACIVWHRRAGKDITCWNWAIKRTAENPMTTRYGFPTNDMARDNMWDNYTNDGLRLTDYVPKELRVRKTKTDNGLNESLKRIELVTGGNIRIISVHRPERARGGNPKLFLLSEFQLMDPRIIDIIEPILEANDGILVVNMTPAGNNHARATYEGWQKDPAWFTQTLTADDTPVFKPEQLVHIRESLVMRFAARGLSEEEANAFFLQEYYCSFDTPIVGAYFGAAMTRAREDGRICAVPWEPKLPVNTYWDLGIDDSMSIWFGQTVNNQIRLIDYYENSGEGLTHYAKHLRERPYVYGTHYYPFDIEVRELGTGVSRAETTASLGIGGVTTKKIAKKEDGIEAIRNVLSRCWFDEVKCKRGVSALENYHKKWNDKMQVYEKEPEHDWSSHGTDAMQTLALNDPKAPPRSFHQRHQQMNFGVDR